MNSFQFASDSIYGDRFRSRVKSLGIEQVLTAPRSPWQSLMSVVFIMSTGERLDFSLAGLLVQ